MVTERERVTQQQLTHLLGLSVLCVEASLGLSDVIAATLAAQDALAAYEAPSKAKCES
jgi:hypothetical protein